MLELCEGGEWEVGVEGDCLGRNALLIRRMAELWILRYSLNEELASVPSVLRQGRRAV